MTRQRHVSIPDKDDVLDKVKEWILSSVSVDAASNLFEGRRAAFHGEICGGNRLNTATVLVQ